MHELSIALDIIDIAEANARQQNCLSIQTIKIRLGEFTTIVPDALDFAFEVARRGTLAHDARLEIETVPMITRCVCCGVVTDPLRQICLRCPKCGLPLEIVSGEELEVEYIEVESQKEGNAWIA